MKFKVVLADPPWLLENVSPRNAVKRYYPCMTVDAICNLPIRNVVDDDAMLLLWTGMQHLPYSREVMDAWGFQYLGCAFTWVKVSKDGRPLLGVGHYTRHNAELCLLGRRGKGCKAKAHDVSEVIMAPRREHSRKPDEQYTSIMRLFDGPYLEVFARQQRPGWWTWGNEVQKFKVA